MAAIRHSDPTSLIIMPPMDEFRVGADLQTPKTRKNPGQNFKISENPMYFKNPASTSKGNPEKTGMDPFLYNAGVFPVKLALWTR